MQRSSVLLLIICCAFIGCGEDDKESNVVNFPGDPTTITDAGAGTDIGFIAEPTPGSAGRFTRQTIDANANGPAFAEVADVNGDGKLDLIISEFGQVGGNTVEPGGIAIYLQGDSIDEWQRQMVTSDNEPLYWPNSVHVDDIDGDGDMDLTVGTGFLICEILSRVDETGQMLPPAPCGGLFWFEQTPNGWVKHDIVSEGSELFYHHGLLADIDNDGILDMVTVGERRYLGADGRPVDDAQAKWFKGVPTAERFETTPRAIGPGMGSLAELNDIDGDGDLDLISAEYFASFDQKSFAWYENVAAPDANNATGTWVRHVIDDSVGPAIQMTMVPNFYGDGRTIAIGSNHTQTTGDNPQPWESAIFAYEPAADPRQPWTRTQLSENIVSVPRANQAAPGIFDAGDVDGDGDMDLLVSGDGDSRVFLLAQDENQGFTTWVLDENLPQAGAMKIVDLDNDGTNELIVTSFDNNVLYMYRNNVEGPHPLGVATQPSWGTSEGGSIRVNYDGSATGQLVVALFTSWPPAGPPSGFKMIQDPSYPVVAEFPSVEPGDYVALAFIDVDGSGPMGPNEGDVQVQADVSFPTSGPIDLYLRGDGGDGPQPNPGNRLRVTYGGNEVGPLVVAMFSSWPPMGPPSAFEQFPAPTYPVDVEFPTLAPGEYTAMVFIDVDGSGIMAANAEDVQARETVNFPADQTITIDLGGSAEGQGFETVRTEIMRNGRLTPLVAYVPNDGNNLPMVVFTPGFQLESAGYAPLCEAFAQNGYVVARLDPPGTIFDVNHIEMGADVRMGINWLLNQSPFADRIDGTRVGTMGHSLGGKLAIMNAIEDPRVQAVFAIDPVDGDPSPFPDPATRPDLVPGPIDGLTAPLGLIGETTNATSSNAFAPACAPAEENFQTFFESATASDWVVEWNIVGADHMDFVYNCPEGLFSPCELCDDGPLDAARVREITLDLALAFFGLHFNGEADMNSQLTGNNVPPEVEVRQR
ncbi:MAG: hypothetical protein CMH52_06775 [Myxococcales bacterium]|nr:hypothetical protein [Myxococcales bacterium]